MSHATCHTLDITLLNLPTTPLFTDDTGCFHPSHSGHQYIMVTLHGSNTILVQPFASKKDTHCIAAYQSIYAHLKQANQAPRTTFPQAISNNNCTNLCCPMNTNAMLLNAPQEPSMTTSLPQSQIYHAPSHVTARTICYPRLNSPLLWPTSSGTSSLAWHALFGAFNFDATPIGCAGSQILIHHKVLICQSWDFCTTEGFHLGPALHHYHCYHVFTKGTNANIITDAVRFGNHVIPALSPSLEDKLLHALHAIQNTIHSTPTAPTAMLIEAIHALKDIIHHFKMAPTPPQPGVCTHTPPAITHTLPPAPPGVP